MSRNKDKQRKKDAAERKRHLLKKEEARVRLLQSKLTRSCGDCTQCCTLMGVVQLGKAEYEICQHACNGCAIYDSRPKECSHFECFWRLGGMSEEARPDKKKMMFFMQDGTMFGETILVCMETEPDVFDVPENKEFVQDLSEELDMLVYLKEFQGVNRSMVGPPEKMQRVTRMLQEKGAEYARL